jgi:uncharacterized repeat protein (TIGR01451 family)
MHTRLQLLRGSRLPAVLLCAAMLLLSGNAATAHAGTPDPQLSIAVDNGATSATSGDELTYAITLTNLGTKKVEDLRVSQTVPSGASVVSVDARGDRSTGKISWKVDLAAAGTTTVHATLALGRTPDSALRIATVACAQVMAKGPALVCASDSDQLPAGAAVERAEADAVPAAGGWLDGRTPWYAGGGAALVLVVAGAVLLVRRHRHHGVAAVVLPVSTTEAG